jgi:hypothetical protein
MESPFAGLEPALPLSGWRNGHRTPEKVSAERVLTTTATHRENFSLWINSYKLILKKTQNQEK